MRQYSATKRIAIFLAISIINMALARYAALSISNIPGVVTFYFAVVFMIPFALWFGTLGVAAAYVGCFVGSGIPAGLTWQVNLFWSLGDLWQVLIPLLAFMLLKANIALKSKRDFGVFLVFGVVLNNLVGALWGSGLFVLSGQFVYEDFWGLFTNWLLGNMLVTVLITPLLLRFVTPVVYKKSNAYFMNRKNREGNQAVNY
jgi:hypothetical protein